MISIDPSARISPLADLEDSVRGTRIVVGPGVTIDAFVKIKPAGGIGDVTIGAGSTINSGCVLYSGNGIDIGKNVAIAANCTLAPVNHAYKRADVPIVSQGFGPSKGGVTVGDDVWIGANCVLLDGTRIGVGCVIGAGSIVRGELEPFGVYGGSPLRLLGHRS
ncbi:acyltransferase [Luteibacter sp. 9133]|uniref:acyltransferase n=1 Tax=Luteibacter sp. 9133 TaxID=1500891 RepID=UPI0005BAD6D1|nr:acyltransferase [Luteibacter sp. 9133]